MSHLERAAAAATTPLVRSTAALVLNTGINGALGLAYWVVAARLYDPSVVGLGAGGVSSLVFVAGLGWIGLQQVLLRYLPGAGSRGLRLIAIVYAIAIAAALVGGIVFLVVARSDPNLAFLVAGPGAALGFLGAVFVWVVFSLQDPVLIGIGRSALVPLENLAFGVTKLVLLVAFVNLAHPWAILGSWALGASWLVVLVTIILRRGLRDHAATALPPATRLVRFGLGQHVMAVVQAAPDSVVPLIVLATVGSEGTAYYYAAWTVSFSVRLLAVNLGSAATAEGGRVGVDHPSTGRRMRSLAVAVVLPAVVATWLLAELLLMIYGPRYAAAADLLRLLIVAVVPFTAVTLFVVAERIAERTRVALATAVVVTGLTLGLDALLLPRMGIIGAGWGWLIAQIAGVATVALATVLRRRRSPARSLTGA